MAEQATKIMEKVGDAAPEALTKAIPMDIPPQHQSVHPGVEHEMKPRPVFISDDYRVPDGLATLQMHASGHVP
eukprot:1104793-Pelagomonas_calceolata.AAC.2